MLLTLYNKLKKLNIFKQITKPSHNDVQICFFTNGKHLALVAHKNYNKKTVHVVEHL